MNGKELGRPARAHMGAAIAIAEPPHAASIDTDMEHELSTRRARHVSTRRARHVSTPSTRGWTVTSEPPENALEKAELTGTDILDFRHQKWGDEQQDIRVVQSWGLAIHRSSGFGVHFGVWQIHVSFQGKSGSTSYREGTCPFPLHFPSHHYWWNSYGSPP